jgi:hypothetical protein
MVKWVEWITLQIWATLYVQKMSMNAKLLLCDDTLIEYNSRYVWTCSWDYVQGGWMEDNVSTRPCIQLSFKKKGEKVFQHKNSFESIITVDTFLKRIFERVKEEIYFLSVLEMGISPHYTLFLLTDDASLHLALYISMLMWIPLVIQTMSGNFWGRKILMVSKSLYSCWILGRKKCGKN